MVLLRIVSNFLGVCSLRSFGNRSWFGTPFSSPSYYFSSTKTTKKPGKKTGPDVSFEFEDKFKVI